MYETKWTKVQMLQEQWNLRAQDGLVLTVWEDEEKKEDRKFDFNYKINNYL